REVLPLVPYRRDVDAFGGIGVLEEPEAELRFEDACDRGVEVGDVQPSAFNLFDERLTVRIRRRELGVESGLKRETRRFARRRRGALSVDDVSVRAVVRGHKAVKAKCPSEEVRQNLL